MSISGKIIVGLPIVFVGAMWMVTPAQDFSETPNSGHQAISENRQVPVADEVPQTQVDIAVERARREVLMLDDIYKTSIVLITQHYVNTDDDLPAGEAFKILFQKMSDKGWHQVRLIDASGEPLNDDNSPKVGFEETAVQQLVAGKTIYDEVIQVDGRRFLQSATALRVVMEKCIICHSNYEGLAAGQAIGALSYKVPIFNSPEPQSLQTPTPQTPTLQTQSKQ